MEELERSRTQIGSMLRCPQQRGKVHYASTDRLADTARWLRHAEEDLITAETFLGHSRVAPRQCCWHAQQAAEKALKAVLIFLQIDFPRTHDLNILRDLVPERWQLKNALPNLGALNRWAVQARYPEDGQGATETDASTAVEHARSV